MKSLSFSVLCSAIFLLFITSCKKNDAVAIPPVTTTFSTLLKSIIEIDSTLPIPKDTIYRATYTYDAQNRLSTKVQYNANLSGDSASVYTTRFDYTGDDTIAFRAVESDYETGNNPPVHYTTYDTINYIVADGKIISDTLNDSGSGGQGHVSAATNFTFAPNLITKNSIVYLFPHFTQSQDDRIYFTKINDDITYEIDSSKNYNNSPIDTLLSIFETTITYLPNPNPLYKIASSVKTEYFEDYGIGNFSGEYFTPKHLIAFQTGNLTTINSFSGTTTYPGSIKYDYIFRADGYPLQAWMNRISSSLNTKTKLLFIYN